MNPLIRIFNNSNYNFINASLNIVQTPSGEKPKGRGVISVENIAKENTIVCLFPGEEIYRYPETSNLPRENWPKRNRDTKVLDSLERDLPVSDYAIRVSVLDFDAEDNEIGYHWRFIEPMMNSPCFEALRNDLSYDFPTDDNLVQLPEEWLQTTARRAALLHGRLVSMRKISNKDIAPVDWRDEPNGNYAFYFTKSEWTQDFYVVMRIKDKFHPICDLSTVQTDREPILYNIKIALNTEFDIYSEQKRIYRRNILQEIKDLRIATRYPHIGAFVNQPYAGEKANLRFVDPHEWISNIRTGKWRVHPRLHALVNDPNTSLSFLQRQAMVTRRPIRAGEELLINYGREDET